MGTTRRAETNDGPQRSATTAILKQGGTQGPAWQSALRRRLLAWFRRQARELPWRETRDPYAIWVSEVMLQQTQVATVVGYYRRFLERFPTIAALAQAPEAEVLRLWEGLGYYRRARQLHAAARRIVADHGGEFPRDPAAVRALPGIGRYTAGAILSIAFDAREPILEANTIRLVSRLLAYRGDPRSTAGQQPLWEAAARWLPRRGAGTFNQALMELGSLVCTPRAPDCPNCPLVALCPTMAGGWQAEIPPPSRRAASTAVREAAVAVVHRGRVLIVRRHQARRWAGLWGFPRWELPPRAAAELDRSLAEGVRALCGQEITLGPHLATWRHGVTRFRITLECYQARLVARGTPPAGTDLAWVRPAELGAYPLDVTARKLADLLAAAARAG